MTAARVIRFDGATFNAVLDAKRLGGQLARVLALMRDGHWRTLAEIATAVGGSEAGVSARLRDLRKPRFGGYEVDRRRVGDRGLHEYRLRLAIRSQGELFDRMT